MESAAVLSVARVAPLPRADESLLLDAVAVGGSVLAALPMPPRGEPDPMSALDAFLFRRWVLEILLLLRAHESLGYNEIRTALGRVAGESLAPKLQDLERQGILLRHESTAAARRVRYALAPAARDLGSGVFALTTGKAIHTRVALGGHPPPRVPAPARLPLSHALDGFSASVNAFAETVLARGPAPGYEEPLATARRFSPACVRKWHGALLFTLLTQGPLRFRELAARIGAGDQALTKALHHLRDLRSVERTGPSTHAPYAITDLGRFDLSLGAPLLLLVPHSTRPDLTLHST